jgi:hypothetical protein
MDGPVKSLRIDADGIPHAKRADSGEVLFHFLHFQGPAKPIMKRFSWSVGRVPEGELLAQIR